MRKPNMVFESLDTRMATADHYDDGPPDDPPRSLSAYRACAHYLSRVECPRRPITKARADEAILRGRVTFNPADRPNSWRFMFEKAGMDIAVAVGEGKHEPGLTRITAYVDVVDYDHALRSPEWSWEDIHVAALLQYLVGRLDHDEIHPKGVNVGKPVSYRGHRIIFKDGFMRAYCVDCGMKSAHKAAWEAEECG